MNIWTIANQKGGVGKTTTAVTLGGLLARRGQRTLLVDMDPHGSMTAYFGCDPDTLSLSAYSLFEPGQSVDRIMLDRIIRPTCIERLYLLPASTAMATLDKQLGAREGMGLVLSRALQQLAGQVDRVLIDCPPTLGILLVNALAACQRLVIPVQTEFLALKGLERMLHTLAMVARARPGPLDFLIVPTLYDQRTRASRESLQYLQQHYPDTVWPGVIPVDTQLREASRRGVPLSAMAHQSKALSAYEELLSTLAGDFAPLPHTEMVPA